MLMKIVKNVIKDTRMKNILNEIIKPGEKNIYNFIQNYNISLIPLKTLLKKNAIFDSSVKKDNNLFIIDPANLYALESDLCNAFNISKFSVNKDKLVLNTMITGNSILSDFKQQEML